MVKCSVCGEEFIKENVLRFINKKLGQEKEPICQKCRKKITAGKFRDSFKYISK